MPRPQPSARAAAASSRRPPRQKVRRDFNLTQVSCVALLCLTASALAYLFVVWTMARQGLDVRHLIDVNIGPREWGVLGGGVVGLTGFLAVLRRTNKTEKMVGYDVPNGTAAAIREALAEYAGREAAERAAQQQVLVRLLKACAQDMASVGEVLGKHVEHLREIAQDGQDHTAALDDLVVLLDEAQVQVSFANPSRLKERTPEASTEAPEPTPVKYGTDPDAPNLDLVPAVDAGLETGPGQRVSPDRVWGPAGPPKLRASGVRSAHRAATSQLSSVQPSATAERHAESLPPLPPLPAASSTPWNIAGLTSMEVSTGVQRALERIEAGAASFDDLIIGRDDEPGEPPPPGRFRPRY